ncbi:TPA: hypothetical protein N0F65_007873 [Lagenidium giganteum]|uniref:Acid phosphatase n=1 Tax=Lagenidium giganteum TaxID=4803 RepID=A0AAV2Z3U1_9STRA|nr:TPA: hypothetical protein N0F65_007873 [Lagenidium giganteum]
MANSPAEAAPATPARELELRHVLLFHRHGDRTPVLAGIGSKMTPSAEEDEFWESRIATPAQLAELDAVGKVVGAHPSIAPYAEPRHGGTWPGGQLTQKGVEEMRSKGRQLRERYGHVIDDHSVAHQHVYVLSTNIRRTIQSVQCLLHGMFHDDDNDDADKVDKAKVDAADDTAAKKPVFHIRTFERNTIAPQHPLRVFGEIEMIVADDVQLRSESDRKQTEELAQKVREAVGIPDGTPVPWTAVRDIMTCRKAHDLPLPEGITDAVFDQICAYDAWLWHRLYSRKDFNTQWFVDGVDTVYAHLKQVVATLVHESAATEHPPKLSFFSAHDNSIVALLSALQVQVNDALPEYGTIVAFEVYEDKATHQHFIKVLFDDKEVPFKCHEHDPLCPFTHVEALALEFLGPRETL